MIDSTLSQKKQLHNLINMQVTHKPRVTFDL